MSESNLQNIPTGISVHNYKIAVKGIKKKVIYHFSDVHLTEYDSFSDEEEKNYAIEQTRYWEETRYQFAESHNERYTNEQTQSTHMHFLKLLSVADSGDALVMCGDIFDYINKANLRFADSELRKFSVPFMYVRGNHEELGKISDEHIFSQAKNPVQIVDLSDIIIFGIDNSLRQITAEQNEELKRILSFKKPLIIAMHIPIMTEKNRTQLEECGEYFQLNHKNATAEVFEFINIIKQNSGQIVAVLAGHLHFANNSEIAPGVTQYVSAQGALGNINRYEIGI